MMNTTIRNTVSHYTLLFLFFGVIGWLYEVTLAFLYGYGFVNRGFLFGPYLPLYGFGALLLIACLQKLMKRTVHAGRFAITPFVVFLLIVLITTVLEYAVSFLLETIFDQRFWDYSTYAYQLHGRICLSASIRFGIGGMIFLYILVPLFTGIINKIPHKQRFFISTVVLAVLTADLIYTLYIASIQGFNPALAQPKSAMLHFFLIPKA